MHINLLEANSPFQLEREPFTGANSTSLNGWKANLALWLALSGLIFTILINTRIRCGCGMAGLIFLLTEKMGKGVFFLNFPTSGFFRIASVANLIATGIVWFFTKPLHPSCLCYAPVFSFHQLNGWCGENEPEYVGSPEKVSMLFKILIISTISPFYSYGHGAMTIAGVRSKWKLPV